MDIPRDPASSAADAHVAVELAVRAARSAIECLPPRDRRRAIAQVIDLLESDRRALDGPGPEEWRP